jgi:hypothetical protein
LTAEGVPDLAKLVGQGGDPRRCWCQSVPVGARILAAF